VRPAALLGPLEAVVAAVGVADDRRGAVLPQQPFRHRPAPAAGVVEEAHGRGAHGPDVAVLAALPPAGLVDMHDRAGAGLGQERVVGRPPRPRHVVQQPAQGADRQPHPEGARQQPAHLGQRQPQLGPQRRHPRRHAPADPPVRASLGAEVGQRPPPDPAAAPAAPLAGLVLDHRGPHRRQVDHLAAPDQAAARQRRPAAAADRRGVHHDPVGDVAAPTGDRGARFAGPMAFDDDDVGLGPPGRAFAGGRRRRRGHRSGAAGPRRRIVLAPRRREFGAQADDLRLQGGDAREQLLVGRGRGRAVHLLARSEQTFQRRQYATVRPL
jgi:hypothetical protein